MMSEYILSRVSSRCIYIQHDNPVCTVRRLVLNAFKGFDVIINKSPFITYKNLDTIKSLDKSISDDLCYFVDNTNTENRSLLRPSLLTNLLDTMYLKDRFIFCGDIFQKSSINRLDYPVKNELYVFCRLKNKSFPSVEVRNAIGILLDTILAGNCRYRIMDAENEDLLMSNRLVVETYINNVINKSDNPINMISAGCLNKNIANYIGIPNDKAWMIKIDLDVLAMAMFNISDRRVLWSENPQITSQFKNGKITKYVNQTNKIIHSRDVSIMKSSNFTDNNLYDLIRDIAGDKVEEVQRISEFTNIHTKKQTVYYRLYVRNTGSDHIEADYMSKLIDTLRVNAKQKLNASLH